MKRSTPKTSGKDQTDLEQQVESLKRDIRNLQRKRPARAVFEILLAASMIGWAWAKLKSVHKK